MKLHPSTSASKLPKIAEIATSPHTRGVGATLRVVHTVGGGMLRLERAECARATSTRIIIRGGVRARASDPVDFKGIVGGRHVGMSSRTRWSTKRNTKGRREKNARGEHESSK